MKTLKECLATVSDPRQAQGKRYDLVHALLYCVLAVASGATLYRKIHALLAALNKRVYSVVGDALFGGVPRAFRRSRRSLMAASRTPA